MHHLWIIVTDSQRGQRKIWRESKEFYGVLSDAPCLVGKGKKSFCQGCGFAFQTPWIKAIKNKSLSSPIG